MSSGFIWIGYVFIDLATLQRYTSLKQIHNVNVIIFCLIFFRRLRRNDPFFIFSPATASILLCLFIQLLFTSVYSAGAAGMYVREQPLNCGRQGNSPSWEKPCIPNIERLGFEPATILLGDCPNTCKTFTSLTWLIVH